MTTTRWKVRKQAGGPGKHAIETEDGEHTIFTMRGAMDSVAAQIVREHNEFARVEKAYMDATAREVILQEQIKTIGESLQKVCNMTDGHPVDADRRDRIHSIAKAALRLADGEREKVSA